MRLEGAGRDGFHTLANTRQGPRFSATARRASVKQITPNRSSAVKAHDVLDIESRARRLTLIAQHRRRIAAQHRVYAREGDAIHRMSEQ